MSIEKQLREQLTAAIRAKDLRTANVIRMVNTKVMERRTAKDFEGEVDDALYLDVIGSYKNSLGKARVEFEAAGERAAEQIADLDFEVAYLRQYLPEPLGEDAVREAVREAVAELGATDPKMTGRVIGAVMKKHKGLVEAPLVKRLVAEALAPKAD